MSRCRSLRCALALVLFGTLSGCWAYATSVGLQPFVAGHELETDRDNVGHLSLPGIDIAILLGDWTNVSAWMGVAWVLPVPLHLRKDPVESPAPFAVYLRFYPRVNHLTFDPMDVELAMPDGTTLKPTSYSPPRTTNPGARIDLCDPAEPKTTLLAPYLARNQAALRSDTKDWDIEPSGAPCFWLVFDTPIRYDSELRLRMLGLKKSGNDVDVPEFTLRKARFSQFRSIPI